MHASLSSLNQRWDKNQLDRNQISTLPPLAASEAQRAYTDSNGTSSNIMSQESQKLWLHAGRSACFSTTRMA